jgi:glycosyltransferase involved in cell wall biosynthesis
MPRVLMLFNRPRQDRLTAARAGQCPDELLYGLRALERRGWEVVTTDEGFADSPGTPLWLALDDWLGRGGRRTGFNLKQAWRLRRLIESVDVVFATADSSGLPVLALQDRGVHRTPVVYGSIGLVEAFGRSRGFLHALYARWLRRAARVIVYAQAERDALIPAFGLSPDRVRFVPFGVDTAFFATDAPGSGPPLSFGLDHRRDWPTLFAAVAGLDASIEVVANPDVLRGLAVPRNVRLLPPQPVAQLRDKLRDAAFVALAVRQNLYSGGTISLLQSMAAGRAVIVSQTRAIAAGYGLTDDENCVLVPPGDVPALATAIRRLHQDPAVAARIGQAAQAHVRRHLTVDRLADAIDQALREALA